jgi:hypothetical protein
LGFRLRDKDDYGFFLIEDENKNKYIFQRGILGFGEDYYLFDMNGNLLGYNEYDPSIEDYDFNEEGIDFNLRDDKTGTYSTLSISKDKLIPYKIDENSDLYKKISESY